IKNVDAKIERVLALYADGEFDRGILDRRIEKLNREKNRLVEERKAREEMKTREITYEELEKYHIDLSKADFETKQAIVQKLLRSITIDGKSVTIEWLF